MKQYSVRLNGENSTAVAVGEKLVAAAEWLRRMEPIFLMIIMFSGFLLASVHPVHAQTPGGSIFGGNDQTLSQGIVSLLRWMRNLLFILGVFGIGWGCVNVFLHQPCAPKFIGGGLCLAFGSVSALIYSFSQGKAVNFDTDTGN